MPTLPRSPLSGYTYGSEIRNSLIRIWTEGSRGGLRDEIRLSPESARELSTRLYQLANQLDPDGDPLRVLVELASLGKPSVPEIDGFAWNGQLLGSS
jgi:hypothetical protein